MINPAPSTTEDSNRINRSNLNVFVIYEDAKRLVNQGFSVLPIKPRDKAPATDTWKEYQKRKPTDEELHEWFDRGDKNIAIVCGRISGGLVVVDFDDPSVLDFLINGGIDKFSERTLVVKTGKGYHAYFRAPESLLQNRRFDNLKIDIKGEGGYVVAPPSIHREGTRYEFLSNKEIEFNDKFGEFLAKLQEKDEEFKYAIIILPYWDRGRRNYIVVGFTVFAKLRLKWSLEKIVEFILGLNRMKPFPEDPYREGELEAKIKNAFEKEYNYRRFLLDDIGTDELLKALENMAPKESETKEKRNEWFNEEGALQRDAVIMDVLKHFNPVISNDKTIYIWDGDRYNEQGREIISRYIQENVPEISSRVVNDITDAVANITFKTRAELERMELPLDFIPVRNGLLNWRKMILEPHNPKFFYSQRLPVDFRPKAFPTRFMRYLLSRFEGNYKEAFKVLEDLGLILFRDNRYQIVTIYMGQSKDPSGLVSGEEGKTLTAEVIFGEKFLGHELFSRASLQSLAKSEFEFQALRGKWLHVASLDESGHVSNYFGLIEQLRDPYIEKPVKNRPIQQRWKNTTYNILTGNKFPKATANTKAFYRTIRKIVFWRKPIGEDWKYKDEIDEEEKSGLPNLGIFAMHAIEARGKPYGLLSLNESLSNYRAISDSLSMLISQIFEKAPGARIEEGEALEYVMEEAELRDLVIENLTKTKLTALLKENLGVTVEETTENKEEKDKEGNRIKTKKHINYYKGIKIKDNKSSKQESQQTTIQNSDTFEEAILDYVSGISEAGNIGVSEFHILSFYIYNIISSYYSSYIPEILNSDTPIHEFETCLENKDNSLSLCVSELIKRIGVSGIPSQAPEPKQDPKLDQKAVEFFKSLKDKLQFFKDPKEHLVTREPSNVVLYLQVNDKLTEEEARSILKDWVEKGLVKVADGQVVLGDKAQEENKNDNH